MFSTVERVMEVVMEPENAHRPIEQQIRIAIEFLEENNISIEWFIFESILYELINVPRMIYDYLIFSIDAPITTIENIQMFTSHVSFASIPEKYRQLMYKLWAKRMIIDVIRFVIVFIVCYKIQQMLLWRLY